MKTNRLFLTKPALAVLALLLPVSLPAVSVKFTSSGTFTPPAGVTNIIVECWGGGGAGGGATRGTGGGNAGGGGGGGGAYAKLVNVPVTPLTPYTVTIPPEAACDPAFTHGQRFDGANVSFTGDGGVTVTANGGQGGACVITTSTATSGAGGVGGAVSTGLDGSYSGGNGGTFATAGNGGSGGSGASDLANGNNGTTSNNPGAAKAGSDADHNGGAGANGKSAHGAGNVNNVAPGGGGGGGKSNTNGVTCLGSNGRKGQIIITYSTAAAVKANNTDNLNLGSSWVSGTPPDASGIAKWDATVASANTTVLGASLAWGSISILDPAGLVTIDAGHTLTNNGNIDMSLATADLTLNCGYAMGNSAVWNVASGRTLTVGGNVSGGFSLTKQGTGKVVLSGTNTYSGATAVTGGTLQLGASGALPDGAGVGDVSIAASALLDLNGFSDAINGLSGPAGSAVDNTAAGTTGTLTVGNNNAGGAFAGLLQNSGVDSTNNLVKTGTGQLTLTGANTLSGTVTVNGGILSLGNVNPLGNIRGLTIGGATLGFAVNGAAVAAPVTLAGNAMFRVEIGGALGSLNGPIGGAGDITFATGNNTLSGNNRISIGAAGSFTGNVTITTSPLSTVNSLTLQLAAANALPATAVVTLDGENGGNGTQWADLDLAGFDQALAGLVNVARSGRLQRVYNSGTAATLTLSNSADYAFSGALGKASGNDFGLTKGGAGTFTLAGTNHTYNGPTTVNGGTLLVQGLAGSGVITVNQGATLAGTGTLSGDSLTVSGGGVLSPGVGTNAGTLQLDRATLVWLKPTSTFVVHLNGSTPGTYDRVLPKNDILLEQPTLQVVLGYTPTTGDQYTIIDSEAGFLDGTFAGVPNAGTVTFGGYDFRVDYGGLDGNAVVLTCIAGGLTPPTLAGGGPLAGNSFPLSFSGPAGQSYQVLVTTNLAVPLTNWAVLSTGTFGAGPATYTDTSATNQQRFYLIKSP
ncbi:MAG: hypothetical protein RJA22_121 [Verrucomicrobiota bacterium]|jgi:autotransporter-associated beta strand protein